MVKLLSAVMATSLLLSGCGVTMEGMDSASMNSISENQVVNNAIYQAGDDVEINIRPQDDYYGFVNAESLWNTSVEYGQSSAGSFNEVAMLVDEQLDEIIDEIISSDESYEAGSAEANIKAYYQLYENKQITDKAVFDQLFERIDNVASIEELLILSADIFTETGVVPVYGFNVDTDSYNPTQRCLSLTGASACAGSLEDIHKKEYHVSDFRDNLTGTIQGLGYDHDEAEDKATEITYLWLEIANNTDFDSMKNMEMDKVLNPYTYEELGQFIPVSDVKGLLEHYGLDRKAIDSQEKVYVNDPVQAKVINDLLTEENLEAWKLYTKCQILTKYASLRPQEYSFGDVNFDLLDKDMIYQDIKDTFYGDLGYIYKEKYYTEELDNYMNKMAADIKAAYIPMIKNADWLSDEARNSFIDKFNNIEFYLGGEDASHKKTKNFVGKTILESKMKGESNDIKQLCNVLETPVDKSVWAMGAQEVNACYDPNNNAIYITTAIMNSPFIDMNHDYYENLGALGVVVCHELSHAFDSHGVKYDLNGIYRPEWISEADNAAFQERVDIVDAHYDKYALLEVYHVDGEKTVAENLADIGGMQCVLSIAKSNADYENIFKGYATVWKTLYRNKDLIGLLKNDPHSPNLVRVNAVLSCFDEFYDVYDVKEGDGMYIDPAERVKRW